MRFGSTRAQVGIGTLIVFVAMVLVASIAAGVLLNTSGYLQSQAEGTGQQASAQTTDRLRVVSVTGNVSWQGYIGPSGVCAENCNLYVIDRINLTVTKSPGADDVSLPNVTIQYVDNRVVADFVHQNRSEGGSVDSNFSTAAITDDDGSITNSDVLDDADDTAKLTLYLDVEKFNTTAESLSGAPEQDRPSDGTDANLVITTESGGETTVSISVPDHLADKSEVDL